MTTEPDRLISYDWVPDGSVYAVSLRLLAVNRTGLLMDVSTIFGESKTNVVGMKVKTLPNQTAEIDIMIDVRDTGHLSQMMTKLSHFSDVLSIMRMFGRIGK